MNIPLFILQLFEAVACVAAFLQVDKRYGNAWRYFPFYLLFVVGAEIAGHTLQYLRRRDLIELFFNNIEIPIEFLFFFWLFHQEFDGKKYGWLPMVCAGGYLVSWVVDIIYFSKLHFFFYSFSYTVGNLLLLIVILRFFVQLVTSNAILTFRSNTLFWVSLGLLIYYLGSFPYYGLRNTIAYNHKDINIAYSYLVLVLDCVMYLMFILGFIWGKPNTKSLSS